MDRLEELIEKYFDGRTTCAEERAIRQAFAQGDDIPAGLEMYRPLFVGLDKVSASHGHAEDVKPSRRKIALRAPRLRYWAGGLAAGIALCLVLARFLPGSEGAESYVVINGKRYTDPALVQAKALEALDNVSYTDEELQHLLFPVQP